MKFGPLPAAQAQGAILAHALMLPDTRFKKGRVLSRQDIHLLESSGIEEVTVARLEDNDVAENVAAIRIAEVLHTAHISTADAFTGRVNLYADRTGVFSADKQWIDRINRITPAITVATLNDGTFVEAGRMIATVKIIPFAVETEHVESIERFAVTREILGIAIANRMQVGLIATKLPSLKLSAMDKTSRVLKDRLSQSSSRIVEELRVEHSAKAVSSAINEQIDDCDLIIVFGASAITDQTDVIPSAIQQSGGSVDYFGMPVDPGNLLLLGSLKGKIIIGAPGCARSPAENGFDWVLQRVVCGLPVDEHYLSGLGVGGLLMEISARPQPREG